MLKNALRGSSTPPQYRDSLGSYISSQRSHSATKVDAFSLPSILQAGRRIIGLHSDSIEHPNPPLAQNYWNNSCLYPFHLHFTSTVISIWSRFYFSLHLVLACLLFF